MVYEALIQSLATSPSSSCPFFISFHLSWAVLLVIPQTYPTRSCSTAFALMYALVESSSSRYLYEFPPFFIYISAQMSYHQRGLPWLLCLKHYLAPTSSFPPYLLYFLYFVTIFVSCFFLLKYKWYEKQVLDFCWLLYLPVLRIVTQIMYSIWCKSNYDTPCSKPSCLIYSKNQSP